MLEQLEQLRRSAASTPRELVRADMPLRTVIKDDLQPRVNRLIERVAQRARPELAQAVRGLGITAMDVVEQPDGGLAGALRRRLKQAGVQVSEDDASAFGAVQDHVLGLDVPLVIHPDFAVQVSVARTDLLGAVAGLPIQTREVLSQEQVRINTLDRTKLNALIEGQTLAPDEAASLAYATKLHRLVDKQDAVLEALRTVEGSPQKMRSSPGTPAVGPRC